MKKRLKTLTVLVLMAAMLAQLPLSASADTNKTSFSDVSQSDWYYGDLYKLASLGIVNGYPDGTFKPDNTLTRGEFIKMLTMVAEIWSDTAPKGIHWAESDWNALNDNGLMEVSTGFNSSGTLFPCTSASLDTPITRYEMAFLINSVLYMSFYENQMALASADDSFANHISDDETMDQGYRSAVEQVYSKGILTGYADSSFQGENCLTRAEAVAVIVRLAWSSARKTNDWAVEKEYDVDPTFTSFAFQYRTMTDAERRQALFGNPYKTYFSSTADAGSHIVGVAVNTWDINSSGQKYTRTWTLYVNTVVAREVKAIFDYIYNSPEQFPIHSLGGFRTTDTLRHSWGCAIDINPVENYYVNYRTGQQVGTCCYKNAGNYSNIDSRYCISPNGSVVKAFAMYGWGWGGQGWSTAVDYMHFSILASGG